MGSEMCIRDSLSQNDVREKTLGHLSNIFEGEIVFADELMNINMNPQNASLGQ